MTTASPFHEGEQRVQRRVGVRRVEGWARKVIRSEMPDQHRDFYRELPLVVAAARDTAGRPWVTLLTGEAGFVSSPDARTLRVEVQPLANDALAGAFQAGADIGFLGIDFASRRRNRVNGRLVAERTGGLTLRVDQSFGNCPRYIHQRQWRRVTPAPGRARRGASLCAVQQAWVRQAQTFFIASGFRGSGEGAAFGMDASHRGGPAGFVRVDDALTLGFPEYAGNNLFNTLGNLVMDPRVGLLFVDFERGSLLQLTGHARIEWSSSEAQGAREGLRWVHVNVEEVVEQPGVLPLRWQ